MSRLVLLGVLALVAGAYAARPVAAKVPDPARSQVDAVLVGCTSGEAPVGFSVVVRDVNNTPQFGEVATLDFSQTSVRLGAVQESGTTLDCTERTLSRLTTSPDGRAVFRPRFGGFSNTDAIVVSSGGVVLRVVPVRSTDLDAAGGTAVADLSQFRTMLFSGSHSPEADFTGGEGGRPDGRVNLADLSALRAELFRHAPGEYCP